MTTRRQMAVFMVSATVSMLAFLPGVATAALLIAPGDVGLEILNAAGQPETRAGAHPDRSMITAEFSDDGVWEDPKNMIIEMPRGLMGDLTGFKLCPGEQFGMVGRNGFCEDESVVGQLLDLPEPLTQLDLWALEPGPDQAAQFGAGLIFPTLFTVEARPDGNGIAIHLEDLGTSKPLERIHMELWGVPADHQGLPGAPRLPVFSTPTRCDLGAPALTIKVDTWQHPGRWISATTDSGHAQIGCANLPFEPTVGFSLERPEADVPTGAVVALDLPVNRDPDGLSTSQLREMKVALPEGMAISPGGVETLSTCSDEQLGIGDSRDPVCPVASVVGTIEISTAVTDRPLRGAVYLGQSRGSDRFRLLIAASGPGIQIKTVGVLTPDPRTGRLTMTLQDLPEAPLERMTLNFEGGPEALLATPRRCGRATTTATLIPYSGTAPQQRNVSTEIVTASGGCPGSPVFAPALRAGSRDSGAGRPTSFVASVNRRDGEQMPERLTLDFPTGVSSALGAVDQCGAGVPAERCPPSSRIGSASARLGPGPEPASLGGAVYLTGPYKGAPFGVAISFRVAVGPFDLGYATVRGTITVDSKTGRITLRTDPLPSTIEGIPVRLRSLTLDIDRPGFLRNPTSCARSSMSAMLRSTEGASAELSVPFSVHGCVNLPFRPSFGLALSHRGELRAGGRPGVEISGRMTRGDANLKEVSIALPKALTLDASSLTAICARGRALSGRCPKGARIGVALADTPLVKERLQGYIYAVQPRGSGTPDAWVFLQGSGIDVTLQGRNTVGKGGLTTTTLTELPDFPLDRFELRFAGGADGAFELRRRPCRHGNPLRALLATEGQNAVESRARVPVHVPGRCR